MTIKEIREKDDDILKAQLEEHRKHMFDLRTQAVTDKTEDTTQKGKAKKDIARMLTVLAERRRAAVNQ